MPSSTNSWDSDPAFSLVAGLYLALLMTPPVIFAIANAGAGSPGILYIAVLVSITVFTPVGWLATTRWNGLAVKLGGSSSRWLLGFGPACYALTGFAVLRQTGVAGVVAFFFGTFAMGLGFILGVLTRTRYTASILTTAETRCEFTAGWPRRARRRSLAVAVSLVAVGFLGFVAGPLFRSSWLPTVSQLLIPVGVSIGILSEPQTYRATTLGLEKRVPVARRLFPWDHFDGYTRTDTAMILHRRWRTDLRFALADLDDPGAVEQVLSQYVAGK